MMTNFKQLSEDESQETWDKFYEVFHFKPSPKDFPSITSGKPQLKFDIQDCFSPDYPFHKLEDFAIALFTKISKPKDRLYALDWQHTCYDFDPRLKMDRNEFGEWEIPVFPNGDYYIFLTKDFENLWFGHPWEQTITLIGDEIVAAARNEKIDLPIMK